jgi:hypothetical protein
MCVKLYDVSPLPSQHFRTVCLCISHVGLGHLATPTPTPDAATTLRVGLVALLVNIHVCVILCAGTCTCLRVAIYIS